MPGDDPFLPIAAQHGILVVLDRFGLARHQFCVHAPHFGLQPLRKEVLEPVPADDLVLGVAEDLAALAIDQGDVASAVELHDRDLHHVEQTSGAALFFEQLPFGGFLTEQHRRQGPDHEDRDSSIHGCEPQAHPGRREEHAQHGQQGGDRGRRQDGTLRVVPQPEQHEEGIRHTRTDSQRQGQVDDEHRRGGERERTDNRPAPAAQRSAHPPARRSRRRPGVLGQYRIRDRCSLDPGCSGRSPPMEERLRGPK